MCGVWLSDGRRGGQQPLGAVEAVVVGGGGCGDSCCQIIIGLVEVCAGSGKW